MIIVFRYRVKSQIGLLSELARKVNFVWNYCNDRQKDSLRFDRPWLTQLDTGVGLDLGLKVLAVLSDGKRIPAPGFYREAEAALAVAQRARKRRRVKALQARTARRRLDFLHNRSKAIAAAFDHIAVGNVNASGLAKTSLAKSVLDAGWKSFRKMLAYKAFRHGARYVEVDERFTTQTCSNCAGLPSSRPRGIAGLAIRE